MSKSPRSGRPKTPVGHPSTPPPVPTLTVAYQDALAKHRLGQLAHAQQLYNQVLAVDPQHFGAAHMLGVLLYQLGQHQQAHGYLNRALQIDPKSPAAHTNMGLVLGAVGRHDDALRCHDQALKLHPDFVEAWINRGGALKELRRWSDALHSYDQALQRRPAAPQIELNRSIVLFEIGNTTEALAILDQLIEIHPGFLQARYQRGSAFIDLERFSEAQNDLDHVVQSAPDFADAWVQKAHLCKRLNKLDDSLVCIDHALSIAPAKAKAHFIKGQLLKTLGEWLEAIQCFSNALLVEPENAVYLFHRGVLYAMMGEKAKSLDDLDHALQVDPSFIQAYIGRSSLLSYARMFPDALADLLRARELSSGGKSHQISSFILKVKSHLCDWSDWGILQQELITEVYSSAISYGSFALLSLTDDPSLHLHAAKSQGNVLSSLSDRLGTIKPKDGVEKIRVGYYSADYSQHATMILMAELFELHDRQGFEWYAFSFGEPDQTDPMYRRAHVAFDRFIDVRGLSPLEIAKLSRELQIDIAVDLKGDTEDSRSSIFAYRAAPIQVNYLGYPGTMGTTYHDYIIADAWVVPDSLKEHYTEKVVRLPNSYQVNDRKRQISDRPFSRKDCGLPEQGVVYACFNAVHKITPEVFASWMRILLAVPESVLWLFEGNQWAPSNLRSQAELHGIDPQRLIFAPTMFHPDHLARLQLVDLFLDTLPYNAHTTASDALWAGVPVLTRMGQSFAARVAASLLSAVGLPELITQTPEEYGTLAIDLGQHPARLHSLKQRLQILRSSAPLFDTPQFARHLESAFRLMVQRQQTGLPPDHFDIES